MYNETINFLIIKYDFQIRKVVNVKKIEILQRLEKAGVIAVVRGKTKEEALQASHAIVKAACTGSN